MRVEDLHHEELLELDGPSDVMRCTGSRAPHPRAVATRPLRGYLRAQLVPGPRQCAREIAG